MMDIKGVLLQWFINFLIINLLVVVVKMIIFQTKNYTNQLFKKIVKREVHSPFIENIWGTDLDYYV